MERLLEIYKMIPEMKCDLGCSDCCGPVMWMKKEWDRCPDHRPQVTGNCPYIGKSGGCEIYEFRPFICRLFGTTEMLPCPRGRRPDVLLTGKEAHDLTSIFLDHTSGR